MQIELDRAADPAVKARLAKTIGDWKATVARYDDDAKSNEGRKQVNERAKKAEEKRELALARYHNYEFASAAFQIGIVMASAGPSPKWSCSAGCRSRSARSASPSPASACGRSTRCIF